MTDVDIDLEDEAAMHLWVAVGHLASQLPRHWTLVGGLMVQLHAFEHGITDVRATRDIDILGQARPQDALRSIDADCVAWASSHSCRISTATRIGRERHPPHRPQRYPLEHLCEQMFVAEHGLGQIPARATAATGFRRAAEHTPGWIRTSDLRIRSACPQVAVRFDPSIYGPFAAD